MSSVCLYFQVHQPFRVKPYRIFDIGSDHDYFSDASERDTNNRRVLEKVARKSYLPANAVLLELLREHPEFRVSFSISGIALDQFERYMPEVLTSFKRLAETGRVEFLNETYHHSLAFLHSPKEFRRQIKLHRDRIRDTFGMTPEVFRNTELIYSNELAREIAGMGYRGMLAEGADSALGWRSPAFTYRPTGMEAPVLLLKHYRLSDDIAFRFGEKSWADYPLTAEKFAHWVSSLNGNGQLVNLFMDYETFGEHQWEDTGIFAFLRRMPGEILKHPDNSFVTPSEAINRYAPVGEFDAPHYISWADIERDLSAWLSNPMQHDAMRALYALEDRIMKTGDGTLIEDWRRLQTSDHFYYMCTKWFADGDVHAYFNPYESPYEAFISYANVLRDLTGRLEAHEEANPPAPAKRAVDTMREFLKRAWYYSKQEK